MEHDAATNKATTQIHANTFLVLDLSLDGGDGVAALDLEDGGLPRQRLHEDLHLLDLTGVLALVRGIDRSLGDGGGSGTKGGAAGAAVI